MGISRIIHPTPHYVVYFRVKENLEFLLVLQVEF